MEQKSTLLERYNDRLAQVYDEATHATESSWTAPREITKMLLPHIRKGFKVLDLGVGTGQSSEPFYEVGVDITGIDLSQEMLAQTKKKFPEWQVYQADLEKELSVTGPFDVALACGVCEFVADLGTLLGRIMSLLKPRGLFCFTIEEYLPDHPLQNKRESSLSVGILESAPEELSFFVYRRTLAEVEALLTAAGLSMQSNSQFTAYFRGPQQIPVVYRVILAKKEV